MGARERPPVQVDAEAFPEAPIELVDRAVRRALAADGRTRVEISVALLGDSEIRDLNLRYLGEDRTTDVLAFSLGGDGETVGDVYVGFEQAVRQAGELGIPLAEELARLAMHGTLHVLGHDHPEGPDRSESPMFQLQERLLRELLGESPAP